MAGPEQHHDPNAANAAALEAITNAARAYASMAPNAPQMAPNVNAFASLGAVDSSGMLLNPAAAIAAVAAAAAKQLASQAQVQQAPQAQPQNNAAIASAHALMAALGRLPNGGMTHAAPYPQVNGNQPQLQQAIQVQAGNPSLSGVATLNHVTALLQSVSQHVANNQARAQQQQQQSQAGTPSPPPLPPASYTPPPPPQNNFPPQQQPTTTTIAAAPSNHHYAAVTHVAPATHHRHHRPVAAASSNVKTVPSSALLPNIQNWSLAQLDKHVKMLHQMKQPVPQSVALLLADARRKEEKKTAKRVANRKSACTSRARKKALVEEMTRTNARLRRQALILSLLPDLVIVISQEGEITFCSAQVERVLRHKIDDLVGADIREILIPASRTALGKLATELTNNGASTGEENASSGNESRTKDDNTGGTTNKKAPPPPAAAAPREEENGNVSGESSGSGGVSSAVAAVVSDQSFPLSVVKVDSKQEPASDENDNSDLSGGGGKEPVASSLTDGSAARSPSASLANSGGSGSEDAPIAKKAAGKKKEKGGKAKAKDSAQRLSSSDDSSSGSTETKNVRKANENLERNVRWHNKKLKSSKSKSHKDDVLGDSVTPNNALARLSSLQHYPETLPKSRKQYAGIGDRSSSEDSLLAGLEEKKKNANNNENASDDSGYRESNDSREEETASSTSESSNSNGRKKPLAPTCNVCLIREDLTTLWCEVTSSIRTKNVEDESSFEAALNGVKNAGKEDAAGPKPDGKSSKASNDGDETPMEVEEPKEKVPETIEFLLCLRPIRDGGKVDESFRFIPSKRTSPTPSGSLTPTPSAEPNTADAAELNTADAITASVRAVSQGAASNGHLSDPASETPSVGSGKAARKRKLPLQTSPMKSETQEDGSCAKRQCVSSSEHETEKSAVESLILMSNKSH